MATAAAAGRRARQAADSAWVDRLARVGFCARGVVYGVVGMLALQISRGQSTGDASASRDGALHEIAQRPFGRVLLLALAAGLAGYALWRASEALWGRRDEDDERKRTLKRLMSAGKAAVYLVFLGSSLRFVARGADAGGTGGDQQEREATARLLAAPGGRLLVGLAAIALVVGGAYVVYRGLSRKFDERLDTSEVGPLLGRAIDAVGIAGLTARGLVFSVAGLVAAKAAIDFDPTQARGIDGTLRLIAAQTYGSALLLGVSIGLLAYALYSFAEAALRRL